MCQLSDLVGSVVADFVNSNMLFTALDVSNKVKETLPFARHREVRDLVRDLFASDPSLSGYAKSPIDVTLPDNTTATALLYHPVYCYDLDLEYDAQKRSQASTRPVNNVVLPTNSSTLTTSSLTRSVVNDFVLNRTLFTALDVLNKVNEQLPSSKYREVRNLVRDELFDAEIEPAGYTYSNIPITLENGTPAFTLLYHPSEDQNDLDELYDYKKRCQTSTKSQPTQPTTKVVPTPVQGNLNTAFGAPNTTPSPTLSSVSDSWRNTFQTKTSLFPRT